MKKYIYLLSLLGLFSVSSCSLDAFPEGGIVSEDQRDDISEKDPNKLIVFAKGISANYVKFDALEENGSFHSDYGYAAVCQILDMSGQDYMAPLMGYNWFSSTMLFRDRTLNSSASEIMWRLYYNVIKSSNDVLRVIAPLEETGETQYDKELFRMYIAQGYTNRAFAYFQLAQTYQFTYVGNENKPAVPLILLENDERNVSGRATLQQVYDVIVDDLQKAVDLLKGNREVKVPDKSFVDLGVVYGVFAKVMLVMNKWEEAAKYARLAIESSNAAPYSIEELKKPALNTASASSWMWANLITEENDIVKTGIINWPSHLCSFTGNGYTTAGAFRSVNSNLWNKISESDIRKHSWWVDGEMKAPYTDNIDVKGEPLAEYLGFDPYTNIKFGPYQNIMLNTINASDWPMMRIEEMYFIEAEALGMTSLPQGKKALEDFMNAYRYPNADYRAEVSSSEELQDEIWLQRRIEFWGEGLAFFDLKRLKKPVVRIVDGKTSYPKDARFVIPADDPIMLWLIPQKEIEANVNLSQADNNAIGNTPKPQS